MRPAATKCCYLIWIGYIRRIEKQVPKMRSKMKKRFWKSEFDDSYTLWASPGPPPWKKGAWNIVNNRVCAQVSISSANCNGFIRKHRWKKSRKNLNRHCVLLIKMQLLFSNPLFLQQSCEATKSQQQKSALGSSWCYRDKMSGSPWKWRQLHTVTQNERQPRLGGLNNNSCIQKQ